MKYLFKFCLIVSTIAFVYEMGANNKPQIVLFGITTVLFFIASQYPPPTINFKHLSQLQLKEKDECCEQGDDVCDVIDRSKKFK